MKIVVFSDSHGSVQNMINTALLERPDHIIHLGDHVRDADTLAEQIPDCFVTRVAGNCDHMSMCSEYLLREFGGVRFFITHGHGYGVKTGLLRLAYAAMEAEADIVLFGHTHRALAECRDDMIFFNPGSCNSSSGTYGVITISNQTPSYKIKTLR